MSYQPKGRVENYTGAFLATSWFIVFMALWTVAAVLGFVWVIVMSYALDLLFRWMGRRKRH